MSWGIWDHIALLIVAAAALRWLWLSYRTISYNRQAIEAILEYHAYQNRGGNFGQLSLNIKDLAKELNLTPADIGLSVAKSVVTGRVIWSTSMSGVRLSWREKSN